MESPVVEVAEGQLKGCQGTDLEGNKYFCFLGVPFGKPPVGELRFKAPLPAEMWDGVKNADAEGPACYQRNPFKGCILDGSEDCLNLNIFTKTLPQQSDKLKPVIVFIHGGAFITGSNQSDLHGPQYLMVEDIVVVFVNYRLGILGFLSLDDASLDVPGNAGLKDQTLALKWVQRNIEKFGGDPNNVTLAGISAGSASAHFQILSPSAKGLFHKAILQSGCALNPWVYGNFSANEFVKFMGKQVENDKEALEILRNAPIDELYSNQEKYMAANGIGMSIFTPVIEKPNETAFITKDPFEILSSGDYNKVPLLIGYTSNEGLMFEANKKMKLLNLTKEDTSEDVPKLEDLIPPQMKLGKDDEKIALIHKKLTDFYSDDKYHKYSLESDFFMVAGIIAAAKHHAKSNPVYLYKMTLIAGMNLFRIMAQIDIPGASHGDDFGYLFKTIVLPDVTRDSFEHTCINRFVKLWTNFMKYGNPTPDHKELNVTWKPVEEGNINYLDIGEELVLGTNPDQERVELWKEIFQMSPFTADLL